ncbi:MAG: lipase family protein [Gemmataceae bacterium]
MKTVRPRIRLGLEQLEDRVLPSAAPNIQMTFATTTDSRTLSVNYTISGASFAGQNLSFNIYRSAAYDSLGGAQLIGTATIPASDSADLSLGSHTGVKLSLTAPNGQPVTALTPNTALPFLVVVANSDGSTASFETHVLGVIAHGLEFDPRLWLLNQPPAWELQMAAALQQNDGYQAVIPFNWVLLSILPFPQAIQLAGSELYQQVVSEANQLASQHPGDVVDINFIGHSRGTVVVSEVLQDLVGTSDPALRGGYMQMTLLDPHPANLLFSQFSWASFLPGANDLAALVIAFELLTRDPQVVVPPNVEQTYQFDEQTPAGQLGFPSPLEIWLNLWGEMSAAIPNQSAQPIESRNLTNATAPGIGLIGHSEVPNWYLANVVDTKETFTYFG